jgi:FixJ family two-component response regulator
MQKIYIVDDDESVCRALKLLMMAYGFMAQTFSSAEEFFGRVPSNEPGCLIIDIHMPGLNGLEAQQQLLRSGSLRPVIIITADKNDDLKEQAIRAGAKGFLQKPFNDQELLAMVNL